MRRERKELACGDTELAAKSNMERPFNELRHMVVYDPETRLYSVFNQTRKNDRTLRRPITRVARRPYSNGYGRDARRPVVVTLLTGDMIETRLKGTRRRHAITWDALHAYLVRRDALAAMRAKQAERAARRKAKKHR